MYWVSSLLYPLLKFVCAHFSLDLLNKITKVKLCQIHCFKGFCLFHLNFTGLLFKTMQKFERRSNFDICLRLQRLLIISQSLQACARDAVQVQEEAYILIFQPIKMLPMWKLPHQFVCKHWIIFIKLIIFTSRIFQ